MAIRLDLVRQVTDDELLAISERNPGYQFERTAKGELVVSPTGSDGGRRSLEVAGQIRDWNRRHKLGVAFDSSAGFRLPDGSCRSPDASWIRRERWESLPREARAGFAALCPDAVFELRSPSNTVSELREKMQAYLDNGARLSVLLDPDSRAVEVYRPGAQTERHAAATLLPLDPELPGFVLDCSAVFED